jgi:hypothetical protein
VSFGSTGKTGYYQALKRSSLRTRNENFEIIRIVERIILIIISLIRAGISRIYGLHRTLFHDGEYRFSAGFPSGNVASSLQPGLI